VYIVTNKNRTVLYTGFTSDLEGRVWEHKQRVMPESFATRYCCDRLVWFENFPTAKEAIACEKMIKGWVRRKKIAMITVMNPTWRDLGEDWQQPEC
jgi:putative endonuclease